MYIADFHIHSKYSRATSPSMDIEKCAQWSRIKGIDLLGTGDITHPLWRKKLQKALLPTDRKGIYSYRNTDFILTEEVNSIYHKNGRLRRVHNILFFSSFERAENFCAAIAKYGDLTSDGRPILSLDAKQVATMVRQNDPEGFIVPAHIWTPHFSLFGAHSGFDHIEDCFEEETAFIPALETGLSSDPPMNRRLSSLDKFTLISNSDAHSPQKLAREANIFSSSFSIGELYRILKDQDRERFLSTVEYFPEEGKYHLDGHRNCNARSTPEETIANRYLCPVCKKKVTVGVMHRIALLADRPPNAISSMPFHHIVPLEQILSSVLEKNPASQTVQDHYNHAIDTLGPELTILLSTPAEKIFSALSEPIASAIIKMREGKIIVDPGYDGKFGTIAIRPTHDEAKNETTQQQTLF